MKKIEFLNPRRKLVDEVVNWLCRDERMQLVDGAHSLAHLMVIVPTAQSGRTLRLALAREADHRGWGGLLPPQVVQPMHLIKPADETRREATPIEAQVAFQQYAKTHRTELAQLDRIVGLDAFDNARVEELMTRFSLFDQLEDIWRALAGRGLLMRDVLTAARETLEADFGEELTRWAQLAQLEAGYFAYLHDRGVVYPTEAVHAAKSQAAIVDDGIEEIVLPALADPVRVLGDVLDQQLAAGKNVTVLLHSTEAEAERFDAWGWPKTETWTGTARPILDRLSNDDLVCATDSSALASIVAADCPPAESRKALPALALCDDGLYQGVASAFLNRGYVVHNPERHLLVQSSLGRLIKNLIALYPAGDLPWNACLAVLRSADVQVALGLRGKVRESVLKGADIAQNAFIPTAIPQGFVFPEGVKSWQQEDLAKFCEAGRKLEAMLASARANASLCTFLRHMLQSVFKEHRVGGRADEREFLAAAESARDFLAAIESPFVAALKPSAVELEALARRVLDAVAYSLEPETTDAVKTEGWLELPWTTGDQVALVGLHEGKVPDSIVGHPFLPDRLRTVLGLVSNTDRLARDTWILKELLASHGVHAVRAYVARTNDQGDICRPSRLLYLCADADLPERVKTLFGDLPVVRSDKTRRIEWPLVLKDEVVLPDHFSASALDTYVKCPFTYLLKYGYGMCAYREKRELEANDFGTFVHAALERYAKIQIARGDDQLTDAADIRRLLETEIFPACRTRFVQPTLNIKLQLDAAEGRLMQFAEKQAAWAQQGWRIREAECELNDDVPELGVKIKGSIDRVDENIRGDSEKRWCLIDYKTWDKKNKFNEKVLTSTRAHQATRDQHFGFANKLGFPLVLTERGEPSQRVLSVQLPVYGLAYRAKHPEIPFADMQFSYCILGSNADETVIGDRTVTFTDRRVSAAVGTAKRAVELIGRNVFWPAGPTDEWKYDFAGLFVTDPKTDLGETEWAKRQMTKLEVEHV